MATTPFIHSTAPASEHGTAKLRRRDVTAWLACARVAAIHAHDDPSMCVPSRYSISRIHDGFHTMSEAGRAGAAAAGAAAAVAPEDENQREAAPRTVDVRKPLATEATRCRELRSHFV
jgi:hypothetical protein